MFQSLRKSANALLTGYSYMRSTLSGNVIVAGMPVSIGAELTNNCNLNCAECSAGSGHMTRERGFMDIELFSNVISELRPYLFNVNMYFQGEPMLHPMFFSFLRTARNIRTTVSTNGHFLSEENSYKIARSGLGKLIISLDGLDQESYSAYRINGSLNTVFDGLKNVLDAKKQSASALKIELQFLVNKQNEHQILHVKKLALRLKIPVKFKSMQIINEENIVYWLPFKERFRRYKFKDGKFIVKSSLHNRCARIWFNPVITWDGKVIPCCFDKNAEYEMGDLHNDSFRDIWNGPKYRVFRKSILTDRHMIEICRNCTTGLVGVNY